MIDAKHAVCHPSESVPMTGADTVWPQGRGRVQGAECARMVRVRTRMSRLGATGRSIYRVSPDRIRYPFAAAWILFMH